MTSSSANRRRNTSSGSPYMEGSAPLSRTQEDSHEVDTLAFRLTRNGRLIGSASDLRGEPSNNPMLHPLICTCGEAMMLPRGGQSHAMCEECGEMQLV